MSAPPRAPLAHSIRAAAYTAPAAAPILRMGRLLALAAPGQRRRRGEQSPGARGVSVAVGGGVAGAAAIRGQFDQARTPAGAHGGDVPDRADRRGVLGGGGGG